MIPGAICSASRAERSLPVSATARFAVLPLWLILCLLPALRLQGAAIRAFPGAEGAGAYAAGGRGGDVYHVINLLDEDTNGTVIPGSLHYGIKNATGPRTIVFDVGGWIQLSYGLDIFATNLTIAGQTAPGSGIGVQYFDISPQANDLIIRYLHCATGYGSYNGSNANDCITIETGTNVILDHVSTQFGGDETISATHEPMNLTVQWCILSDSLNFQNHGYGSLIAPSNSGCRISWHHNLYSNNDGRTPRAGSRGYATNFVFDYVNNVNYNWGSQGDWGCWAVVGGNPDVETLNENFVNNYAIAGASSTGTKAKVIMSSNFATSSVYQSGNLLDSDLDTNRNGVNLGWAMFSGTFTQMSSPFPIDPTNAVTTTDATTAYLQVLCKAGAYLNRDSADLRAVNYVRTQTGTNINYPTDVGGFPVLTNGLLAKDTDQDGMPDYWENAVGLNPNVADNNLNQYGDGYTALENYLNWLAAPHAVVNGNGILNVDLRTMMGQSGNTLSFTAGNPTNGTVTLLGDSYTAQFVPTTNYTGLASFDFTSTDVGTGTNLGSTTLVVVVTPTNTAPVLYLPPPASIAAGSTLSTTFGASDSDQPPQTLTFSAFNLPAGATLNPANGKLSWRPAISQVGTNIIGIMVSDSGSPSLSSAIQYYTVVVTSPKSPSFQSITLTNNHVSLVVTGSYGPDYYVQTSTNLTVPGNWITVFGTNSPILPLHWTDTKSPTSNLFYRVLLGP